jgi:hypothetical protein
MTEAQREEILGRLDAERRTLTSEGMMSEDVPPIMRASTRDRAHHWIKYSALDERTADEVIAREITHFGNLGIKFEWKLFRHNRPADLLERLRRQGFVPGPQEAVLIYELKNCGEWIEKTDTSAVKRIEQVEQIQDYLRVTRGAFGRDFGHENELVDAVRARSTQLRGYIAYAGSEPVSAGRLQMHPASWFAGLYGGGTVKAFQGRGFYRALVAARARDAVAAGAHYLYVEALPTSRPILERLGFQWITDTWPCEQRTAEKAEH